MDLRREKDIEHLRRVALAQQVQIEQLLSSIVTLATFPGTARTSMQFSRTRMDPMLPTQVETTPRQAGAKMRAILADGDSN